MTAAAATAAAAYLVDVVLAIAELDFETDAVAQAITAGKHCRQAGVELSLGGGDATAADIGITQPVGTETGAEVPAGGLLGGGIHGNQGRCGDQEGGERRTTTDH